MIIKDIVNLAKHGELSSVNAKDNIELIVSFINLGMLELYKRFPIKVKEHVVDLVLNQTYYEMPNDFMYPLEAYGEVPENSMKDTRKICINDPDNTDGIFFNDWNTVQIPASVIGSSISIIYVAKPVSVTVAESEDGTTELDLPDTLIDCLLHYLGYRGHIGVKSDAGSENNAHFARFERSCKKAEDLGIAYPANSLEAYEKLSDRGFI